MKIVRFEIAIITVNVTPLATNNSERNTTSVNIYPNPSTDYITIKTDSKSVVKIFDAKGNQVVKGITNEKINLNSLSSGFYIAHVIADGELIAVEKFTVE